MQTRILLPFMALLLGAGAQAQAQERSGRGSETVSYAYADVLRVDPVYDSVRQPRGRSVCRGGADATAHTPDPKRDGTAATGHETALQQCEWVVEEEPQRHILGYDVEYRFRGEVYITRLSHDPGDRLRIRISVTPAE